MPMTYLIGLVFVSPSFAKKSSNLKTAHKKTTQFIQASSLKCCDLDARQASLNEQATHGCCLALLKLARLLSN